MKRVIAAVFAALVGLAPLAAAAGNLDGFKPNGTVGNLSVSTTSAPAPLPPGDSVSITNTGSVDASIKLSNGAGTALTTDYVLKAGATLGWEVGSNNYIDAITASGSTALSIAGGSGIVSGYGGGSGGSGGTTSIPSGSDTSEGSTTDAACTQTDTTAKTLICLIAELSKLQQAQYVDPANLVSGLTVAMTGTTSTAVTGVGAPGSALHNYITTLVCGNSHASVDTFVDLQDGSGGTVFATVPCAHAMGGAAVPLPAPLRQPTTNTALYAKDETTGANVIVFVVGYKGP